MQFLLFNGAMPTTAANVKVTTGTAIKTMMQVLPLLPCRVVEWGISFDGSSAATPGECELLTTGTIAATVTANIAADTVQYDAEAIQFNSNATFFTYSTSATGFTATAEGSIVASRYMAGPQLIAPTNQFIEQFPLGYRPYVKANDLLRIRVTFAAAINAYCYVILEF
jgi:hypothetical protein